MTTPANSIVTGTTPCKHGDQPETCLVCRLEARVADLEALHSLDLIRIESQRQIIVDLQNARAEDMRQASVRS